jgi:hypothetical protein
MCSACGGDGQACCPGGGGFGGGAGTCLTGFACVPGMNGAADSCTACGSAIGQPCCGTGPNRSCDAAMNLSCVSFSGMFVCDTTP